MRKFLRRTLVPASLAALTIHPATATPLAQPDSADPANGKVLYAENCASCHGPDLRGEPDWRRANPDGTLPAPPHDETGHTWHHGDGLLFSYTYLGGQEALRRRGVTDFNSAMPAFGGDLTNAEIWDILAYIKSTWDPEVQAVQAERTSAETAAN